MNSTQSTSNSFFSMGAGSGIDSQAIIDQIMQAERIPIDKLEEEKELNTAKIDIWNDIADQLKSFADVIKKLRSDGTSGYTLFDDKTATSSQETVATAIAKTSAATGSYNLTVSQIAQQHVIYGDSKSPDYTLSVGGNFCINGKTVTLQGGESLADVVNAINSTSFDSEDCAVATIIDNRLVLQTADTGASQSIHGSGPSGEFVVANDDSSGILQELGIIDSSGNIINEAQSSQDAVISINGIDITKSSNFVDDAISGVSINILDEGSSVINVSHDIENVKETIKDFVTIYNETRDMIRNVRTITTSEDEEFGPFASDALLRELFNQMRSLTTSSVRMGGTIWNGELSVKTAASSGDSTITLQGFDSSTGTISAGDLFTVEGETYTVSTEAEISNGEVTLSLTKTLSSGIDAGSSAFVKGYSLESFGVEVRTDTFSGLEGVLGVTDEALLDEMLQNNIDVISNTFKKSGDSSGDSGVARRIYDWLDSQVKISVFQSKNRSITDNKIPSLESANERLETQIKLLERRLEQKELSLIKQFSRMESLISQSQSAGSVLSNLSQQ